MAANKNRRAHNIIEEKGLDIDFKAITFTTFGGFGEGTHELIKEVTKDTDWSLNDPWAKPNPKSHAYLTFGFALARANARTVCYYMRILGAGVRRTAYALHARNLRLRRLHLGYASVPMSCIGILYYKCILYSVFCILYSVLYSIRVDAVRL